MVTNQKERRERIIETVVTAFLETGKPVNSAYVSTQCGLGLKPASIRALMKDLEQEGYLAQPHTSAGRIPTVKCYRYYVQHCMADMALPECDLETLRCAIEAGMIEHDADMFLHHMATVLSEITDLVGVVMSPGLDRGVFDRLEIVSLGGSSYLVVLSLKSGFVNTIRITIDHVIPRGKIEETSRLLTERFSGLTVSEIKRSITARLEDVRGGDRRLVEVILKKSDRIFTFDGDRSLYIAGLTRALARPDFAEYDHSLSLISLFEEKGEITDALKTALGETDDISIHIGGHGLWGATPPLSLVSAVYHSGAVEGAIGIIGPTRIHYPRLSALVRNAAAFTSHFFMTN